MNDNDPVRRQFAKSCLSEFQMENEFIINGKFLRASMTGVHRVAYGLCNALADLASEQAPQLRGRKFEVWHTADGRDAARTIRLPTREVGPFDGILWEQVTLPARQGRAVLLNFCNMGPMVSGNALTMIHDRQVTLSPQSYSLGFRLWYKLVQGFLARRNRALLTVSDFSRAQIAATGLAPIERVHTIHNGVDHILRDLPDPSIINRLSLDGKPYFIALSTVQAHKNIGILLETFARPEMAGMSLLLVGSTGRKEFASAGYDIPANVIFAGRVSDGEMRSLIEAATALAFPSITEGFGFPPLEAMLLGTPAVCSPCEAVLEICGDAVLYADPDKSGAWANALSELLANRDLHGRLTAAGKDRAAQFTWRNAALRLLEILDAIEEARAPETNDEDRLGSGTGIDLRKCAPFSREVTTGVCQ